jgi:hypothetical protein
MTRDDIIRMAREAGFQEYLMRVYRAEEGVHHFAALVAAAEREACATACEEFYSIEWIAQDCAAAIRARGRA